MKPVLKEATLFPALILLLVSMPFLVVKYVPAADLPQHLAQVRLFWETLHGQHAGVYRINWISPNVLVYGLVAIIYQMVSPLVAGKLTMLLLALAWVISIQWLAAFRGRSVAAAMLASALVFNHCLYWGFINYLIGMPFFVLWLRVISHERENENRFLTVATIAVSALALLLCHALWFAVGIVALVIHDLLLKKKPVAMLRHGLGVLPIALMAAIWIPTLEQARRLEGFDNSMHWAYPPWVRLTPSWLLDAALGGIYGIIEPLVAIVLIIWIVMAIVRASTDRDATQDRFLITMAAILFAVVILAPDKYMNTIQFSSRWFPVALTVLIIGLPEPKLPRQALMIIPLFLMTILVTVTTVTWIMFNDDDLSGLDQTLAAIPENSRVLGMDLVKEGDKIKGRQYIQLFAYSQVLHGGELNFSFAEHHSGIVVEATKRKLTWHGGLEWMPETATVDDIRQFDFTIVNTGEKTHAMLAANGILHPVTDQGYWRLYTPADSTTHDTK